MHEKKKMQFSVMITKQQQKHVHLKIAINIYYVFSHV